MDTKRKIMLAAAVLSVLLFPLGVVPTAEAKTYEFNISLDSPATHGKTMGTQIFIQELVKRSEGRLKPTIFHSAPLYKDAHVTKAVNMGTVQMAVVGNYLLDGVDINATVTHLPMFFGQALPEDEYMQLLDEVSGPSVNDLKRN